MIKPFTWYLHDDDSEGFEEQVLQDQLGLEGDLDDLMQKIGRPFYEVKLECTLNTETGDVEIVKVTR